MNSKTKRNLVCSHTFNSKKKSKKNSQCYPDELNYKMKDVWNSKCDDNKSKRIYSSSPKEIKQELYDKNKECNHDICLIKNVLPKEDYESTLPYFAPIANWKPNSNKWLNTLDIENVMHQYETLYPSFNFLGVCPVDWDYKLHNNSYNTCVCKTICDLNLQEKKMGGINKLGAVFNLDEHDKPGSHWVSLFIDNSRKKMYFFDSTGSRCPTRIKKIYHKLKAQEGNEELQFFSNYRIKHQKKNSECGVYCLYFLLRMLSDNNFDYFVNKKKLIPDKEIAKYRDIYFNVL